jgi:hypothetical protein
MSETVSQFLLWCTVINYVILLLWAAMMLFAPRVLHVVGGWYGLSPAQMDLCTFGGLVVYKMLIIVFNLVPWVVLRLVR